MLDDTPQSRQPKVRFQNLNATPRYAGRELEIRKSKQAYHRKLPFIGLLGGAK